MKTIHAKCLPMRMPIGLTILGLFVSREVRALGDFAFGVWVVLFGLYLAIAWGAWGWFIVHAEPVDIFKEPWGRS